MKPPSDHGERRRPPASGDSGADGRAATMGSPADEPMDWRSLDDVGPYDEYDTPAEVDATFRTQRRIAFSYLALFVAAVLCMPVLTMTLDWWSTGRLFGAMSPNFAMAAAGLYLLFLIIGVGAASLASAVEDRMLGWSGSHGEDQPSP